MVLSKLSVLGFIAFCASAQVQTPWIVQATSSLPGCVRLYEQRTNGSEFQNICAASAVTTSATFSLPNNTAGGVLLVQPTAGTPLTNFFATNSYAETFKPCYPGTAFGVCWTLQTRAGSGGLILDFLDTGSSGVLTLDRVSNAIFSAVRIVNTGNIDPSVTGTYSLGSSTSIRWSKLWTNSISDFQLDGNITPQSDAAQNIGSVSNRLSSLTALTLSSYDSSAVQRVVVTNPGGGSNSGSGIIVKNAAGTSIFSVGYGGTTITNNFQVSGAAITLSSFTGGANASLCVDTIGSVYRGTPGC